MQETSLQAILEARRQSSFVGRTSETVDFEANAKLAPEDEQRRFIFAVCGQGGMGKSTLMAKYRSMVGAAGYASAWSDEDDEDLVEVMNRLAGDLNQGGEFDELREKIAEYHQARHAMEADPDAPEHLARIVAGAAGRGGTKLARRIPIAGAAFDFVDEDTAGDALGNVAAFVLQRTKHRKEAELVLEPREMLTPLFVAGLNRLAKRVSVALFFDTFEETAHVIEPWLQRLIHGQYGLLPPQFLCSIAGRYPLSSDSWGQFESVIRQVELGPLTVEESREFLRRKDVTDEETARAIIRLSHGLPILLVAMSIGSTEAVPSDTAVDLVLRSVPDDFREVALAAAVPRTLDRDTARVAVGDLDQEGAFEWLIGMPFVVDANEGWKYHAVIREEFLRYAARESTSNLAQVHRHLVEFHAERRKECFKEDNTEEGMAHGVEVRYHRVAGEMKNAVLVANRACLHLWAIHPELARASAVSLRDGERDQIRGGASEWGKAWVNVIDEYAKGHEQPAIELLGKLLSDLGLDDDDRAKALVIRGDLYFHQDRYELALEDAEAAIKLDRSNPRFYYERAWVHQRCRRPEEAFMDVESALKLVGDEPAPGFCDLYLHCASDLLEPTDVLELARSMGGKNGEIWSQLAVGRALRELGRQLEAVDEFERVAEIAGRPVHGASEEIGASYLGVENYGKAVEAFEAALETNPNCALCWSGLAEAAEQTMEDDEVEAMLREVCKEIDQPSVRAARGVALLDVGLSEGLEELRAAIEQNPVRPEFHFWLGQALEQLGRPEEGIVALEEALRLRPDWPQALMVRGICRSDLEEFGPALEDWEKVERTESPDLALVSHCDWGLALSIIGRYPEAIAHFDIELAVDATPQSTYNRAVARASLVGAEEVAEEIKQALADMSDAEDDLVRYYGRGGLMAMKGEAEQALDELAKACRTLAGAKAKGWAKNDPAWNGVRTSPEFQEIIG